MDIASLGIRIQTDGAKEAAGQLDQLASSSKKAESAASTAADQIKRSWQSTGKEVANSWKGLNPSQLFSANKSLADYRKGLEDARQAAQNLANKGGLAKFFGESTKSAKELQFATRTLPAQFTDIATALGSGQRPLTILLQQGGQIKDMYGGIGPALAAVGRAALGLVNPFTVGAAAVAGLGFAFFKAQSQAEDLGRALIVSGQNIDLTTAQLRDMARTLDDSTTATAGKASDVLAQVTASGRFTADQIQMVAKAAIQMEATTGQSIEETIKQFAGLAQDPVEAILKLNETQHFLTEGTIRQIEEFEKQGREADAVSLAFNTYADTINQRTPELERNLSSGAALFRDIKTALSEAADGVVQFFAQADTAVQGFLQRHKQTAQQIAEIMASIRLPGVAEAGRVFASEIRNAAQQTAPEQKPSGFNFAAASGGRIVSSTEERKHIQEVDEAQRSWNSSIRLGETDAQRLKRELDEAAESGKKLGKTGAEIASAQDAIRTAFAEHHKGRKPRKESETAILNASDRFDDMVGALRSELEGPLQKAEEDHLRRVREIEQAAVKGKRSHDDLTAALNLEGQAYEKTAQDIKDRFAAEAGQLSGPVAAAQSAHEEQLRRIDLLTQQAGLSAAQHAKMLEAETRAYNADMQAAQRAEDPMGAMLQDMQFEIGLLGKSNAERTTAIQLRDLERQGIEGNHDALLALNQAYEDEQKGIRLMDDFRQGATDALTEFVTGTKSAKDALKDFFNELAAQITRAIAQNWMDKLFGQQGQGGGGKYGGFLQGVASLFTGGGGSEGGDQAAALSGAAGKLTASAAPLYGAAAALSASAAALAAAGAANGFSSGMSSFGSGWGGDSSGGSWAGAIAAIFGGGRAYGGDVEAGKIYEVGEHNKPELLQMHGRSYLIPGNQGNVVPISAAHSTGPTVVNQNVYVQGRMDSRTADQIGQSTARAQNRASARNR